jgi:biopolymer transport protein ExbD
MKFQRNTRNEVGIDLTSLIDVVFILLLFFMLATTFSRNNSLIINLPEANGEAVTEAPIRIDIVIDKAGLYAVNGAQLSSSDAANLRQAITDVSGGDTSLGVTITADADTTHQSVVTAMDTIAQLGFTKLNIATRQVEAAAE